MPEFDCSNSMVSGRKASVEAELPQLGRRTYVMGIINLTPDSFSGDGLAADVDSAVALALKMECDGADIIDIGAESSRPGASPVSAAEELERLMPGLEAVCAAVKIPVSVDTYKASVAASAIDAGASIINDVWGFLADGEMARVAADAGVPVVLMHNQREARYHDLVPDVIEGLNRCVSVATGAGVDEGNIVVDPGIGFGKTADHNLELLRRLPEIKEMGFPMLLGVSRKSTIGRLLNLPQDDRVEGTAAAVSLSIVGGADIVRVHDVKQMVRVVRITDAVVRGWRPDGWQSR